MNRSLVFPAGCCLFAFTALLAALHGAKGREASAKTALFGAAWHRADRNPAPSTRACSTLPNPHTNGTLLSSEEAKQVLTTLAGEYVRPWQEWEASPHRLYSRAAPRPLPPIYATVEMSPHAIGPSDALLVATIAISSEGQSEPVPCVVDRITKQVRLYAEGQWLTDDEWLKTAPRPWPTKS